MEIVKIKEGTYQLRHNDLSIHFSQAKWEDLYYAVPLATTAFLRLLQDDICTTTEERFRLNQMLILAGDRIQVLDALQKQIQTMK